jgi:hypothetical protein
MLAPNPLALFDSLFIASHLEAVSGSSSPSEIQSFAYLGCLMHLYGGGSSSEWGYVFLGTEAGAPFSSALAEAFGFLVDTNSLYYAPQRVRITARAAKLCEQMSMLATNSQRLPALQAACSTALALSPGIVCSTLNEEPELHRSHIAPSRRPLLQASGIKQLHLHFEALRKSPVGDSLDLRVPAIVWLEALFMRARSQRVGSV